jgi:oxygen-independent coproporphyrinogen III oxidase
MAGIYIHIPFCHQACHYCDFHFSTNLSTRGQVVAAIERELKLQRDYLDGEGIKTVYFGGGTPSLLDMSELEKILRAIRENYPSLEIEEITIEANPEDLSMEKLVELRSLGFNRLSLGIQTFDDEVLRFLNRSHDGASATRSYEFARAAGFENISIDLIYAIPTQSTERWINNINHAINLQPQHISSYSLTIEPKTVFGKWEASGRFKALNDDQAASQLEVLCELLVPAGYEQYEVSNFARPGFYSLHNGNYWKQQKYLGIGPSAHSYNGTSRQWNVRNNAVYVKSLEQEIIPFEKEFLSRADHINEYLLTTLRTSWGADLAYLANNFQYDVLERNRKYIEQLIDGGYAALNNKLLKLTEKGKLIADKIASDLFFVDEKVL